MGKIIVANWKMNPNSAEDAKSLFDAVKNGINNSKAEVIICPPYVYLSLLRGLTLGAQNVSIKESGAFTGQVSAVMLKDIGVQYSIVGHSESRQYLKETNQDINQKIVACLNNDIKVILCIGENEGPASTPGYGEAKERKTEVLDSEILEGLSGISEENLKNIIIAYEPIFAIGTGKSCSIEETKQSISIIKNAISKIYSQKSADEIKIIYGGSVNSQNAEGYLQEAGVDGLLVGGASLKPEEFIKIVESAN